MFKPSPAELKLMRSLPRIVYFGIQGESKRVRRALVSLASQGIIRVHPLNQVLADVELTTRGSEVLNGPAVLPPGMGFGTLKVVPHV